MGRNADVTMRRLLIWQLAHTRNTEELLVTARRLSHAAEALESEIKKTGQDISEVHKSCKHTHSKKRRSAR